MVMVRRRYADGGKVRATPESRAANRAARDARIAAAAANTPTKPKQTVAGASLGTGALHKAASAIRNTRKQQEESLGLKNGGYVSRRSGKRGKRC